MTDTETHKQTLILAPYNGRKNITNTIPHHGISAEPCTDLVYCLGWFWYVL